MSLHLLHFSRLFSKVLKYLLCISMIRYLEIVACFLKTRQCRPNPILKAYIIGNQNIFLFIFPFALDKNKKKSQSHLSQTFIISLGRSSKKNGYFFFEIQHWNPRNVLKGQNAVIRIFSLSVSLAMCSKTCQAPPERRGYLIDNCIISFP